MKRVRITGLPKKANGGSTGNKVNPQSFIQFGNPFQGNRNNDSEPQVQVNKSISSVPRSQANIEAEGGEFATVPGKGGIPESYNISGPRHNEGGVPLNLEKDSFIFSDHKKGMKIKDKEILKMFSASKPSTPAELAKKFPINDYKKILMDPNSDELAKKTAEQMIKNYNIKQGQIALIQEAKKGFPQGIPAIATPYLSSTGMNPEQIMPQSNQPDKAAFGAGVIGDPQQFSYKDGGSIHINPANKGKLTEAAARAGMSVKEFARHVLANKEDFSTQTVRRANFARNAENFKHQNGGEFIEENNLAFMQNGGANKKLANFLLRVPGLRGVGANMLSNNEDNEQIEFPKTTVTPSTKTTSSKEVKTEEEPKINIPSKYKDSDLYNKSSSSFNKDNLKVGDYYLGKDGSWRKITYIPEKNEYTGNDKEKTFNNDSNVADSYAYLEQVFKDPKVKEQFANEVKSVLNNKEYYKGKHGGYSEMYDEKTINNLTPDKIVDIFLKHQKRNYSLQAHGINPKDFSDANGTLNSNISPENKEFYSQHGIKSLNDAFNYTGVPITKEEQSNGELGLEQGSFWGFRNMLKNKSSYDTELQNKLQYLVEPNQEGTDDEPMVSTISPIDSKSKNFYTNTTSGQLAFVDKGRMREEVYDPKIKDKEVDPIKIEHPEYAKQPINAQWWAQDIGNMGNLFAQDMGLKKYLPHSFPVDLARPDVLYYDPSRAIANAAESEKMAQLATSAFSGPQSTYRMTGIAGDAFKNKANVMADYEGRNVQVGNEYLDKVKNTQDQENTMNADREKRLMDEWVTANQQYDNSKRDIKRKEFEAWRDGLTNKWKTQAMNYMYPQFNTIPGIGGGMFYTGTPRPFDGTSNSSNQNYAGSTKYLKEYQKLKQQYPNASDAVIKTHLDSKYGSSSKSNYELDDEQKRALMQMYNGINL